jgi:quercetin dioxygenase-like cupin family protein
MTQATDREFAGKVAFVTGAGSGIGRATAIAFAQAGANVSIADISQNNLDATAAQIEPLGVRVLPVRCDVSKAADVKAALDKTTETFGSLDRGWPNAMSPSTRRKNSSALKTAEGDDATRSSIMNRSLSIISLGLIAALASACSQSSAAPSKSQTDRISVTQTKPQGGAKAFPGSFTGNASITAFLNPTDKLAASGAVVAFEARGRTAWHSHPAGQTLFVTAGTGWVQEWGGKKIEIKPGDVVWTPPGVKHWHGGTTTSPMTHVAIQALVGGKNVDWMEPVTDEQYEK